MDNELGRDDLQRAQNRSADNNHDEVQPKAQGGEAFWEVGARAITREEEVTKGSQAQSSVRDGNELGGKETRGEIKYPWFTSLCGGEEDTEGVPRSKVGEFVGRGYRAKTASVICAL